MIDLQFCDWLSGLPVNPQLHAFWHIFASSGLFHLCSIVYVDRLEQEGKAPYISYNYSWIPVVNYKID
jgi:dihydroceramidase